MRDQNRSRASLSNKVSQSDMDKISQALSKEFTVIFTEQLQEKGEYEIVDSAGDDVLTLRPAIVDLDVTAPDISSANMSRTYVTSAGQMTLYLELIDSATGDVIGKAVDRQHARRNSGQISYSNRVTNKAEADRILRRWASLLRDALDDAQDNG
jgi:hypothetical protein